METREGHFYNHFFYYILIPLILITGILSYFRFIVKYDYIIEYEVECDPYTQECFIGNEEDENGDFKQYYYFYIHKHATDLYKECGKDITDCEASKICLMDDKRCSMIFCDPEIDGNICDTLSLELRNQPNFEKGELSQEDIFKINFIEKKQI